MYNELSRRTATICDDMPILSRRTATTMYSPRKMQRFNVHFKSWWSQLSYLPNKKAKMRIRWANWVRKIVIKSVKSVKHLYSWNVVTLQMYYSLAVNISSRTALVQPLLSIPKEGMVPTRPSRKHTKMSSSYSSLDWISSHWAHFTLRRFICVYVFVYFVVF